MIAMSGVNQYGDGDEPETVTVPTMLEFEPSWYVNVPADGNM
jgi:hypothetical protein